MEYGIPLERVANTLDILSKYTDGEMDIRENVILFKLKHCITQDMIEPEEREVLETNCVFSGDDNDDRFTDRYLVFWN